MSENPLCFFPYYQHSCSPPEAVTRNPEGQGMAETREEFMWQIDGFYLLMPLCETHQGHGRSAAGRLRRSPVQSWDSIVYKQQWDLAHHNPSLWKLKISFLWKSASSTITEVEISSPLRASVCVHIFSSNWEQNLSDILIAATVEMHVPIQTYVVTLRPICP